MNTDSSSPNRRLSLTLLVFLAVCFAAVLPASAQNTWTGTAGDTNWSTPGNWSFNAIPTAFDQVVFDNVNPGTNAALVDNILFADFVINSLTYGTVSTNGFHTTLIPSGQTLSIDGAGGNAIFVGTGAGLGSESVYSRFVGGGRLTVTNTTGAINVIQSGSADNDHRATLDLSGLTNFTADVSQIMIASSPNNASSADGRQMGTILLADTNEIRTAAGSTQPGIIVASQANGQAAVRGTQQLLLGRHNVISSDAVSVGGHKQTAQLLFRTGITNGFLTLRGSAGGMDPVKLLTVGDQRAGILAYDRGGTGTANAGTLDTTGNALDLIVTDVFVGRSQTNGNGGTTGTLTFNQGTIVADNVSVGFHPSPAAQGNGNAFNGTGTINVNGTGTMTVNNDLLLARKAGTNNPNATINIASNATLNVKGNVVSGGGNSTLNLNGTLDLQPSGDGTPGNATFGTITGGGSILDGANITNSVAVSPGDLFTAATLNIGGNYTLSNTASINMNAASAATVGGGVNDLINVTGNIILNSNVLNGIPIGATLAAGPYRIMNYTGSRTGFLSFTNLTRYNLGLDYATAGQINLVNAGGAPGNLTWRGTNGNWNLTTSNWNNGAERFFQLDAVTFDNTGLTTNITIAQQTFPSSVTVNSSTNYYFAGAGRISGGTGLTKSGTGTLRLATANDFTGPITVTAGTLQIGNSSALGLTNSGTTIASGATLDVSATGLNNPGESITISGTGVGGQGAILNSGAEIQAGLRFITLAADAAVAATPIVGNGRWDLRGLGGAGVFGGNLNLNGFTLTKLGVGKISLVDSMITNAGSIMLSNGTVGLTRSIIDGPGTITGFGTNTFQIENSSTGYITKPFVYNGGGGILHLLGNAFTLFSPITNNGGLTISNAFALTLTNIFSGPGSLIKISNGDLIFQAPNLSTGPMAINGGSVVIGTNSSVSGVPSIAIGAGASLVVTQLTGGLTLASGQILSGSGSVIGDVTAGANTGIVPGTSPGTLSFSNNLVMNNTSNVFELNADPTQIGGGVNDLAYIANDLTLGGVNNIKIVPVASLNNASPYTLFQYGGTLTGVGANLSVSSDSRYAFTVVDPGTTPGSIQVSVTGSGTSASLTWKGGAAGNPTAWDTKITTNWLNGVSPDSFFLGDNVTFDDTAATNRATLVGTIQPATMIMNNSSLNYTLAGSGSLVAGSLTVSGTAGLSISNTANNSIAAPTTINSGYLTLGNFGQNTFSGGLILNAGSVLAANAAPNEYGQGIQINGGTMTIDHPLHTTLSTTISNATPLVAGTFVKAGVNQLSISGNNTNFDGPILVNGGTLRVLNGNALGNTNGTTTITSGATLDVNGTDLNGNTTVHGESIIISGAGLSSTGAVINTSAEQQNAIHALTLAGNASIGSWGNRWDIRGAGGSASFSGGLNLGGFTLNKLGAGRISVVDANMADAGIMNILGGALAFTRTHIGGDGYINVGPNLLIFENNTGSPSITKPFVFSNGTFQVLGAAAFTMSSPITNSGTLAFDLAGSVTALGTITGPGGITTIGTAALILGETNNYTGGTLISAGMVQVGAGGVTGHLPAQPGGVLTNNGTLAFNRADDVTYTDHITGSGGIQQFGSGIVFLNISNSFSGQAFINSSNGGAIRINIATALGDTNGNTRINGDFFANSRLELVNNLTLTEPLQLDGRQRESVDIPHIQSVSGSNTINSPIVFNTGGTNYNFQSDSGFLTVNVPFIPPGATNIRELKLMGEGNGIWNGAIGNSTNGLVPGLLQKVGNGTWTLTASNDYSGETTISAGTLALGATGSISVTTNINVESGATFNVSAVSGYTLGASQMLMGNGTVSGNVSAAGTVAPGTLTPGAFIGTLTFQNNLVLSGTTVMELDRIFGPNADLLVANSLTYGGTLVVTNVGDPLQNGDTFDLFNWTTRNGSFGAIQLPALDLGLSWNTANLNVNGTIQVVSGVNLTPTNIVFQVIGNNLEISWPEDHTGWRLESQTNPITVGLNNNWATVPDSATTNRVFAPIVKTQGTVFYRLVYP